MWVKYYSTNSEATQCFKCLEICLTWSYVLNGMRWSIGNGQTVRFWEDKWLFSSIVLISVSTAPVPHHLLDLPVSAFINDRGE